MRSRSKKLKNRVEVVNHARNGDYDKLLEDLRDFGDPDSKSDGETALEAAILNLNLKEVDLLVKYRASLTTRHNKPSYLRQCQMSELKEEKPFEYKELIDLLLNAGAPVDDDATAIFYQLSRSGDSSWSEREDIKRTLASWWNRLNVLKNDILYASKQLIKVDGRNPHAFTEMKSFDVPFTITAKIMIKSFAGEFNTFLGWHTRHNKSTREFRTSGRLLEYGEHDLYGWNSLRGDIQLKENTWYDVAVFRGISTVLLYVDGKKVGESKLIRMAKADFMTDVDTSRGRSHGYDNQCLNGEIKEIIVFKKVIRGEADLELLPAIFDESSV